MSRNRPDSNPVPSDSATGPASQGLSIWILPTDPYESDTLSKSAVWERKRKARLASPGTDKKNHLKTFKKNREDVILPSEKLNEFRDLLARCIPCSVCFVDEIESVVQMQLQDANFSPFVQTNEAGEQIWKDPNASHASNVMGTKTLQTIGECSKDFSNFLKNPSPEAFKKFHSSYLRRLGLTRGMRSSKIFLDKATFDEILESPHALSQINHKKALSNLHLMKLVLLKHMQFVGSYIAISQHPMVLASSCIGRSKQNYHKALITTHAFLSYADKAIGIISDGKILPDSFWSDIDLFSNWVYMKRIEMDFTNLKC